MTLLESRITNFYTNFQVNTQFFFWSGVIVLCYLALAGAAVSMGFPFVFHFFNFSLISFFFLYFFLFCMYKYSLFERTLSLIKKNEDFISFLIKVSFIFLSFCFFTFAYTVFGNYPESEIEQSMKKDLVNPLQVGAQLSCFFFYFKYKRSDVRKRQLLLTCLVFCVISTLYLLEVRHFFFSFCISLFSFFVYRKNIDYVPFFFYILFCILPYYPSLAWLSKWIAGFDLLLLFLGLFSLMDELPASHGEKKIRKERSPLPKRGRRARKTNLLPF